MVEAQNDQNKCIISEANGFAMGLMAITTDVNLDLLNDCFELRPFHGLRKPHVADILVSKPSKNTTNNEDKNRAFESNSNPETQQKLSSVAHDSIDAYEFELMIIKKYLIFLSSIVEHQRPFLNKKVTTQVQLNQNLYQNILANQMHLLFSYFVLRKSTSQDH
jgi:hypothetical protein